MIILKDAILQQLIGHLLARLSTRQQLWFREQTVLLRSDQPLEALVLASSSCRRNVGDMPIQSPLLFGQWTCTELCRVLLMAIALRNQSPSDRSLVFTHAYAFGDNSEKSAWLKALTLLDRKGTLTELAIQAGRTNSCEVFTAIALNNPYPAQHYKSRAFHQLVLKALFMDLDIQAVLGLASRRNSTLNQLVLDLLYERLAAEREVPASLPFAFDLQQLTAEQTAAIRQLMQQGQFGTTWHSVIKQQQAESLIFEDCATGISPL